MTQLATVSAGAGADTVVNQNNRAISPAGLFGIRPEGTSGLVLGYYGGAFNSLDLPDGTVTLTASLTNYVVVNRATGAVTASTNTTNWLNTATYLQLYQLSAGTASFTISSASDRRQVVGPQVAAVASWGAITGTLSDQSDLSSALGAKQPLAPRVQTVTSAATVTPTTSNDAVKVTAQAVALTLANPTGSGVDMAGMVIRLKDNGTARAITYGTQYRALGVTLPVATTANKTVYLAMIYNAEDTKWDVVAVGQET